MGMMRRHGWWVLVLIAVGALLWPRFAPHSGAVSLPCADIVAGCALPAEGGSIRFDHQPDALKPFKLFVTWPQANTIEASFQMAGMQMGFNRYRLVRQADEHWQAEVMLPACIQGRKDWLVELDIDGAKVRVPFASR